MVELGDSCFTSVHRKTGEIRHPDTDIVFSTEYDIRPNHIRNIRKDISITTDVIVGFPGETIEEFNETIDTIKKIINELSTK